MAGRLGMTVPFDDASLAEHPAIYAALTEAGYTDLWSVEGAGVDGVTPLAVAAVTSPTLRLGTAILPAYTRGPALLAQTAAALADLAPGRFALGIGASSDAIVRGWNGIPFEQPYQKVRDTVRFVRAALAGEKVGSFRLGRVPEQAPPVLVAGLREQMLRLAGREADGAILNWLAAGDVPRVVAHVLAENPSAEIVCRILVSPTEEADAVRAIVRPFVTGYLTVPVYRRFQEWLGRGELLAPVWDAWDAGDRKAALAAVPDEVVDAVCVHGTPAACRAAIDAYVANGVTTPVLSMVPVGTDTLGAALAFLG